MEWLLAFLFIDAGLSYQDAGYYTQTHTIRLVEGGQYDDFTYSKAERSPYARLAIGFHVPVSNRLSAEFSVQHVSSLMDGDDKGVNSVALSVRWKPFTR